MILLLLFRQFWGRSVDRLSWRNRNCNLLLGKAIVNSTFVQRNSPPADTLASPSSKSCLIQTSLSPAGLGVLRKIGNSLSGVGPPVLAPAPGLPSPLSSPTTPTSGPGNTPSVYASNPNLPRPEVHRFGDAAFFSDLYSVRIPSVRYYTDTCLRNYLVESYRRDHRNLLDGSSIRMACGTSALGPPRRRLFVARQCFTFLPLNIQTRIVR